MSEYEELRQLAIEADQRGDTETASAAMDRMELLAQEKQTPVQQPTEKPIGNILDVVTEPVKAAAGSLAGTIAGGLAGLPETVMGDTKGATETIKSVQGAVSEFTAPRTQIGEAATETLGSLIEKGIDLLNVPLSGLASIAELVTGQGIDQAAQTVKSVQEIGLPRTAGKRILEETGDPLLATVAETTPAIVGSIIPLGRMAASRSALKAKMADQIKASRANPELANRIQSLPKDNTLPAKLDEMYGDIRAQAGKETADKIAKISDEIKTNPEAVSKLEQAANEIGQSQPQKSLVKYTVNGAGKLKTDPLAQEAIKQGFDAGTVSAVAGASVADKLKMSQMVDVMKKGKENALYAVKNRPSDIAGDSLLERVKYVKKINREAGSQLDDVAKSLKGKTVSSDQPIQNFLNNLDDMGITIDRNLTPRFVGSDIEGLTGPEAVVKNIVKRLSSGIQGQIPDAYELHRLKKYIDENVTYGKTGEGLKGKTERILKQLRRDLDTTLDNNFPEYNSVNTRYSDTVNSLDALQDVAGKKMDLFGPQAEKATGTLLRRLMSNAQSRINLSDAVDSLEKMAKKYGAVFDDDISTQMLFADELDSVFGPVARTSLAGEMAKEVRRGAEIATGQKTAAGMAVEAGAATVEKLRGINEENAFKSISELLNRKD